jgi:hypothetical protein
MRIRVSLLRWIIVAAIVAVVLSHKYHWLAPWWSWENQLSARVVSWMTITAGVLLAIYAIGIAASIIYFKKEGGYDAQLGVGCSIMLAGVVGIVAALFAVAVAFRVDWLRNIVAAAAIFPALLIIPSLAVEAVKHQIKRRAERERRIVSPELAQRLSGQTHVISRTTHDPPSQWLELRYYAPDGTMPGYKEVDGQITAYPAQVTWRVEDDCLVTVSSLEPSKPYRYKLAEAPDGQIRYYVDSPEITWKALSFQTREIRQGEPTATTSAPSP